MPLVCLLLHRAWVASLGPQGTTPDLRFLAEREGVTLSARGQSRRFRARRSLALMLERCDPWNGRFQRLAPGGGCGRTMHELHGTRRALPTRLRLVRGAPLTAHVLRHPLVLRRNAARREPDLHRPSRSSRPGDAWCRARPDRSRAAGLVSRGIRWASRDPDARRRPMRSGARALPALRVRGVDAVFVSGVMR